MTEEATGTPVEADEITKIDELVQDSQSLAVNDSMKNGLIESLGPIALRIVDYQEIAEALVVTNGQQAKNASITEAKIRADLKEVKGGEIITSIIEGFNKAHKTWTGLRKSLVDPLSTAGKAIRTKRLEYEDLEREKAAVEERRLQAIEDEKARRAKEEQERLEKAQRDKEAAARAEALRLQKLAEQTEDDEEAKRLDALAAKEDQKADAHHEQANMREENAEAVQATSVHVPANVAKGGSRRDVEVKIINQAALLQAIAARPDLALCVEIQVNVLKKMRKANPLFNLPGVEFRDVRV